MSTVNVKLLARINADTVEVVVYDECDKPALIGWNLIDPRIPEEHRISFALDGAFKRVSREILKRLTS